MTKTATKSPQLKSLSDYIQERFDEFSRSQKDVARYIVDHLDEAAFLTAEELARRASTSSSTVVRFSQALGFEGYPELQQAAIEEYRTTIAASGANGGALFSFDHSELEGSLSADYSNLEETARKLTPEQVDASVAALADRAADRDRRRRPDGLLRQLPAPHPQPARHPRRDRRQHRRRVAAAPRPDRRGHARHHPLRRPRPPAAAAGDEARPAPRRPHPGDLRRDDVGGRRARRADPLLLLQQPLLRALATRR